ncbi:HUN domain-containing protein [Enterobacter asburiae]|uniref:HUN domain-containing protein n=1 Tax=Enterobacter asburiae TaxID=61645 RepID=UPI000F82F56D|nr:HUN domain-containing protein [Enterobacter asburiae]RTN76007.1 hypothetical protein EKN81_20870 [Enterobacter asburiae]RTP74321.1 hypothetical protein EKN32_20870 [Enterobacter asburiae]
MDANLRNVYEHMITLGAGSLSHANYLAHFVDSNSMWSQLGVLQAAHACEIFLKARLAQEHPLLIFESLPKSTADCVNKTTGLLDFESLLQKGQTITYSELPEKVWAATGVKINNLELYKTFGKLRNSIQHFAAPKKDVSIQTSLFIYDVIDPFINSEWGMCAMDYCDDSEGYEYLIPVLASRGVNFIVSQSIDGGLSELSTLIKDGTDSYVREMMRIGRNAGLV